MPMYKFCMDSVYFCGSKPHFCTYDILYYDTNFELYSEIKTYSKWFGLIANVFKCECDLNVLCFFIYVTSVNLTRNLHMNQQHDYEV